MENESLLEKIKPVPIQVISDERGHLWKALSSPGRVGDSPFGELYLVTLKEGAVRGGHFHRKTTEWFLPVRGKVCIDLAVPGLEARSSFVLDASTPAVLEVPPGIAHQVVNKGEGSAMLLAYANRVYDANDPDTTPFTL